MKNKDEILQELIDEMTDEEKAHLGGKLLASVGHKRSPKSKEFYKKLSKDGVEARKKKKLELSELFNTEI